MKNIGNVKVFIFLTGCFLCLLILPLPEGLTEEGRRALAVIVYAVALWFSGVISPVLTALLLMLLFSLLGVIPYARAVEGLGNTVVWLLFGILVISSAVEETGLDKRIAFLLMVVARGNLKLTLLMTIVTTTLFAIFIPTSAGRVALLTPIWSGLLQGMGLKPGSNLGKSIMLSTSFSSVIASTSVITGAISIIYVVGIFDSMLGHTWTYSSWLYVMMPGVLMVNFLLWPAFMMLFPLEKKAITAGSKYIEVKLKEMGKPKENEIKLFLLLILMIMLWFMGGIVQMSVSQACLLVAIATMLPGIEIITWKKAMVSINWGIILMLGASLAMVDALTSTHAIDWLANIAFVFLPKENVFLVSMFTLVFIGVIRLGFPNLLSMIATTFPIVVTIAYSTGVNPVWLGLIGVSATNMGLFLPSQSPSHFPTYATGYYSIRDMSSAGAIAALLLMVITLTMAFLYWPLHGISY